MSLQEQQPSEVMHPEQAAANQVCPDEPAAHAHPKDARVSTMRGVCTAQLPRLRETGITGVTRKRCKNATR